MTEFKQQIYMAFATASIQNMVYLTQKEYNYLLYHNKINSSTFYLITDMLDPSVKKQSRIIGTLINILKDGLF